MAKIEIKNIVKKCISRDLTISNKGESKMLVINKVEDNAQAVELCRVFFEAEPANRYVFGRNKYAESIAKSVDVGFFVDDFATEKEFLGKPVVKTKDIRDTALVVVAVALGRPLTVDKLLSDAGILHLDYFAFCKYSGLKLLPVTFWDKFAPDFKVNEEQYKWVYDLLEDEESKEIYSKILNFRNSSDLSYLSGFTNRQKEQYFEDFLKLNKEGEVFVDVGGFDGFTSLEFIKRCPEYKAVYFFEPEVKNMEYSKTRMSEYENINYIGKGLSNEKESVRFSTGGSASVISQDGDVEIHVDKLDDLVDDAVTYIKMDIEGAEGLAIDGAKNTILKNHPRLAICVYHKADDVWQIPKQVLAIRNDYKIYLRHYTEGVDETVMFFIPDTKG